MSDASRVVEEIQAGGVLAILRLPSPDDLLPTVEALRDGGVRAIEWPVGGPERLLALEAARTRLGQTALIGAGTVLSMKEAKEAIRAGAQFLAAPTLDPEVVRVGLECDVAVIPGAFTATEVFRAWELTAALVKLFPAGSVGPGYVRDLQGPLPFVPLIASGGVTLENAGAFIQAGAAAIGVGRALVPSNLVAHRAFAQIATRARGFVEAVQRARGREGYVAPPVMPVEGPDVR